MIHIIRLKTNIGTLKFSFNSEVELGNATIKELKMYIQKQIDIQSDDIVFYKESNSGLVEVTRDSKCYSNDDRTLSNMRIKSVDLLYLDCCLERVSVIENYVDPISKSAKTKEVVVVRPKMNNPSTFDTKNNSSNYAMPTSKSKQPHNTNNNNSTNDLRELVNAGILSPQELQMQVEVMERYDNSRSNNDNNNNNKISQSSQNNSSSKGMSPRNETTSSSVIPTITSGKNISTTSHHYQQHTMNSNNLSFNDFIAYHHQQSSSSSFSSSVNNKPPVLTESEKAAMWRLYIESCDEADLCRALELTRIDTLQQQYEQKTFDIIHKHDIQAVKQRSRKEYQQQIELNQAVNVSEAINQSQRDSVNIYNISQALINNNSKNNNTRQQQRNGDGTVATAAPINTFSQEIENELFQRAIKRSLQQQQRDNH